jgi:heme/copper-type cytochrome/quinol oxidase subunit 3
MQNIDGKFFAHFFCATSFHVVHAPRNGTMMGLVELRFEAVFWSENAAQSEQAHPSASPNTQGEDTHGS